MASSSNSAKDQYPILLTSLSSFISGGIARCIAHPLDTLKAKIQVQQSHKNPEFLTIKSSLKYTLKTESILGLYRGLSITVLGSLPGSCIYFTMYESSKAFLSNYQLSPFIIYLLSGLAAETVSCVFFVPLDVIKERLQVQENIKMYRYEGGIDAFKQIMKSEGIRGIYKAYGATISSFGPFSALYFLFYEKMKEWFVGGSKEIGFWQSLVCASVASIGASVLTNPLDIAKVRMQVVRATKNEIFPYKNMFHGIYLIYSQEGAKALFQGTFARILFHMPNTAITMGLTEYIRLQFNN